jgi:CheY-like chemotaxis protein
MHGVRILVVEDCAFLGELICDMLRDEGATVIGPTSSVAATLALLEAEPVDLVSLDIRLGHEKSFAIADHLTSRRIPFVFVTACDPTTIPGRHRHRPWLDKMNVANALIASLSVASGVRGPGGARHYQARPRTKSME